MVEEFFCFKYRRVVARDNTVKFEGYLLDIPPQPGGSLARARVEVQQRFHGTIAIYRAGVCLARQVLEDPPDYYRIGSHSDAPDEPPPVKASQLRTSQTPKRPWTPDSGHP